VIASVRHQVRIARPASDVWALVGDAARLPEWFPGIVAADVDGTRRIITTASGLPIPEEITINDPLLRRFQYRIDAPIVAFHRSTIDVLDLTDGECLVTYGVDAEPRTMALVIGGGARGALEELKRLMESDLDDASGPDEKEA
jgi:hypothetical protein